jgi:hypothetical protein
MSMTTPWSFSVAGSYRDNSTWYTVYLVNVESQNLAALADAASEEWLDDLAVD